MLIKVLNEKFEAVVSKLKWQDPDFRFAETRNTAVPMLLMRVVTCPSREHGNDETEISALESTTVLCVSSDTKIETGKC